jgi:uncharacterized protein YaaR (DUF327 family)
MSTIVVAASSKGRGMNVRARILQGLVFATALIVGSYAFGQRTDAPSLRSTQDIEAEFSDASKEERLEMSQERVQAMQGSVASTEERLDKVRSDEGDIEKLNCINEKLAAMKGFLKVSEESYTNLKDTMQSNDVEAQRHHFTLIAIAQEKTRNLEEEAMQCAGEVLQYAGDVTVDYTVNPNMADIDPVVVDNDSYFDDYSQQRLPELTPFQ